MAPMSFLPDKHLFIVTSALNPAIGVFDFDTRVTQTMETLKVLRERVPEAIIVLTDASTKPVDKSVIDSMSKYTNINLVFQNDSDLCTLGNAGLKSQAEIILLHKTLSMFKMNADLLKVMSSVKRIYKLSGRTNLIDGFDIEKYNDESLYGKYVFKKRMASWMPIDKQVVSGADHLLITRMYSVCISLLENYYETLPLIYQSVNENGIDNEHGHYKHIDKQYLIEFDNLYCQGTMASTGLTETY